MVRGLKHITLDDPFLCANKHGHACFTTSLIGEALGQLAAWQVMSAVDFTKRPVAGVVAAVRFHRPAYLGETLLLESFIDNLDDSAVQYHSVARAGQDIVFEIDGALGPMLPMDDFINQDEIRNQYVILYRPGDWASLSKICNTTAKPRSLPMHYATPNLQFDTILEFEAGLRMVAEKTH